MKVSLINPNQCHAFGVGIGDDPYDPNQELGLYDPLSDMVIPLDSDGVTFVNTCMPSMEEV